MIKTLYMYIWRDLTKMTIMALIAFTLVMTIIGVVEPLRKMGLSGLQVLRLFGFTLPVMVSLTLPIAALFGATFVYGRFSQNNELLAARASGISSINLLKPALVLGAIVTVLSLVLSNYVSPALAAAGERAAKDNIEGLMYQKIRSDGYIKLARKFIIHADLVDPEHKTVWGVVVADIRDRKDIRLLIAPAASAEFTNEHGRKYATFRLARAVVARAGDYDIYRSGDVPIESLPLPSLIREQTSWYNWDQLRRILKDPGRSSEIRRILARIGRQSCTEAMAKRILHAIQLHNKYTFTDVAGKFDYVVSAGMSKLTGGEVVEMYPGPLPTGKVTVEVYRRGRDEIRKKITADMAGIEMKWLPRRGKLGIDQDSRNMSVSMVLRGHVSTAGEPYHPDELPRRQQWRVGALKTPPDILRKSESIDLADVYRNPRAYTSELGLLKLLDQRVTMLISQVKAEMHSRIAYSLSCCLMVAMGAALGLVFRGGQVLSAFAIAVIPAALVIVMLAMGKELARNPGVSTAGGLTAIWGGLILLVIGNVCIYGWLMRR